MKKWSMSLITLGIISSQAFANISQNNTSLQDNNDFNTSWWKSWSQQERDGAYNERYDCTSILGESTLSVAQLKVLTSQCLGVAFFDSFNKEEGSATAPLNSDYSIKDNQYVQLKKWLTYSGPVELTHHQSRWNGAHSDGIGYSVRLGNWNTSSKIETKGYIPVSAGIYKLLIKMKETTRNSQQFTGVNATILGTDGLTYLNDNGFKAAERKNSEWKTLDMDFVVPHAGGIKLTLSDIWNGVPKAASIVDDILIVKTSELTTAE